MYQEIYIVEKKSIILWFIILGLIPFYVQNFFEYIVELKNENLLLMLNEMSYLYGALIVAFLSGMQWQRAIEKKTSKSILIIPMIPFFLVWFYNNEFLEPKVLIIVCLLVSLFIDFKFFNKYLTKEFIKLRFIVTLLAIFSYLI